MRIYIRMLDGTVYLVQKDTYVFSGGEKTVNFIQFDGRNIQLNLEDINYFGIDKS